MSVRSETWPISKLKLWDRNPRSIKTERFEELKNRLKRQKQIKPLLVTEDGTVIGGNMRLRAMQELGWDEVWVSVTEAKTDKDIFDLALTDNEEFGYYEQEQVAELALELGLSPLELKSYALSLGQPTTLDLLVDKFGPEVEEDEAPEVDDANPPVSKLGEVYQLGRHRLMCGDSTKVEDVEALMGGAKADMVFTDPPYGVAYEGKTQDRLTIQNDTKTDTWAQALPNYISATKAGAAFYVCCPPGNNFYDFLVPFSEHCYQSATIIWAKNSMVLGHGDYHYQHEPILYGWNKMGSHKYYGGRNQTTLWQIDRPSASPEHPTMKPIALVVRAIKNSSKSDDIVLDLFGGSGTTLIAAESTGRTCYMMELDPKYCDVIRKRYANLIGEQEKWQEATPDALQS